MARVRARVDDLERGDVPAVSAKTGAPCANAVAVVLRPGQRPWSPLAPRVTAVVPLEPARVRARTLLTRAGWVVLVAAAAALVAALTGAGPAIAALAGAALLLYAVLVVAGDLAWIGARPESQPGEVVLTRVHRAFARALDAQYGRAAR